MDFAVGSLVKARGREWVVLPASQDDLLLLRPISGTDEEITGIYLPLEKVTPATFSLPDPSQLGIFVPAASYGMTSAWACGQAPAPSVHLPESRSSQGPTSSFPSSWPSSSPRSVSLSPTMWGSAKP